MEQTVLMYSIPPIGHFRGEFYERAKQSDYIECLHRRDGHRRRIHKDVCQYRQDEDYEDCMTCRVHLDAQVLKRKAIVSQYLM